MHILQRVVLPLLRQKDMLNQLYRAANVLRSSTYWMGLINAICSKIARDIVVQHEDSPDQARFTRIAETILRLTLFDGKAEEDVSRKM